MCFGFCYCDEVYIGLNLYLVFMSFYGVVYLLFDMFGVEDVFGGEIGDYVVLVSIDYFIVFGLGEIEGYVFSVLSGLEDSRDE